MIFRDYKKDYEDKYNAELNKTGVFYAFSKEQFNQNKTKKDASDTYNRAFKEWQDNYKYITELVMVLNWKIWEHHNSNNIELSKVYNDLWVKLDKWVQDNFNADELDYYYTTTD